MQISIDWDDELPRDARQRRETFARFGLASYHAQCVEKSLAILLSSVCLPGFAKLAPAQRDEKWEEVTKHTLGRMLRRLETTGVSLPHGVHGRLERALKLRNWLAHNYFYDRATEVALHSDREEMIAELQDAADYLASVDDELSTVTESWMAHHGIADRERLDDLVQHFLRESKHRDDT